jgi:hypothetical protein
MRQGPLWIAEPPLSTGERMSVNDPSLPLTNVRKGAGKFAILSRPA